MGAHQAHPGHLAPWQVRRISQKAAANVASRQTLLAARQQPIPAMYASMHATPIFAILACLNGGLWDSAICVLLRHLHHPATPSLCRASSPHVFHQSTMRILACCLGLHWPDPAGACVL